MHVRQYPVASSSKSTRPAGAGEGGGSGGGGGKGAGGGFTGGLKQKFPQHRMNERSRAVSAVILAMTFVRCVCVCVCVCVRGGVTKDFSYMQQKQKKQKWRLIVYLDSICYIYRWLHIVG